MDPVPGLVGWLIKRSLRRNFRRICLAGNQLDGLPNIPLIFYANHHSFYDGYLLWYLTARHLGRPVTTWMAEWDKFPLFAALGAQPFPPDDSSRRLSTIRRTARRLRNEPSTVLFYFPEGHLHPPEQGILPFETDLFERLDRVFPEKLWVPVAIHITWWGEAEPTCLIKTGTPYSLATGEEPVQLKRLWQSLRTEEQDIVTTLMEGKKSPQERTPLSVTSGFFSKYL